MNNVHISTSATAHPSAEGVVGQPQVPAPAGATNLLGESLANRTRLYSVDLLRGLVMVIMALDHVRDFFHFGGFDPTDLTKTNTALFMTRWVTHFCAPVFVFLAGTGAFLSTSRGKTKPELARFLLTRGLWLVILELTIVQFAWFFDYDYKYGSGAGVIWAIGWSMVALAVLVFLPTWAMTLFGVVMIATHNLFDGVRSESFGSFSWLWTILHSGGQLEIVPGVWFFVLYPLIPWIGVMAAGYGFGALLLFEHDKRRKWLLSIGSALPLAFIIIRAINFYGDPHPWSEQGSSLFTFFSFINFEKYPPSLLFLLVTLGLAIAALALFNRRREPGAFARALIIFGRVPLFYYILHLCLIHLLAVVFAYARYGQAQFLFETPKPPAFPFNAPEGYGYSLPVVYLVWLAVVLMLYPVCRWFAGVKRRRRDAWLSYL
ncbi:DUF1624 domain-containing protein [soil metagenome]